MHPRLGITLLLLWLLPALVYAAPAPNKAATTKDRIIAAIDSIPAYSPDHILVRFKPGTSAASIAETHRQANGLLKKTLPRIGVQMVSIPKGQLVAKLRVYRANQMWHMLSLTITACW